MRKDKVKIIAGLISMILVLTDIIPTGFQASASEINQEDFDVDTDDFIGESANEGGEDESSDDMPEEDGSIGEDAGTSDTENSDAGTDEDENIQETDQDSNEEADTGEEDSTSGETDAGDVEDDTDESESIQSSLEKTLNGYSVADSYAGGNGTADDPYLIANEEQFYLFASDIENSNLAYRHIYYKLSKDIYLNSNITNPQNVWVPAQSQTRFDLDGDNHTIYNLYIKSDQTEVGMIVDKNIQYSVNTNISNLVIENVKIECEADSTSKVGIFSGNSFKSVNNCNIQGDIYITGSNTIEVGGIVYTARSVENCNMSGNLNVQSDGGARVGGIIYYSFNSSIENCTMNGTISGSGNVGGIIYSNSSNGNVISCRNIGKIEINNGMAGGIACYSYATIELCTNEEGASVIVQNGNAAGIVGNSDYALIIQSCTNYGTVSGGTSASGIVYKGSYTSILECSNEGALEGGTVSGIVGEVGNSSIIRGCVNRTDISDDGDVSGIVGSIKGDSVVVTECVNMGNISGREVAGIIGTVDSRTDENKIIDCYNEGNLIGESSVGGIVNELGSLPLGYKGITTLKNCYNRGEITVTKVSFEGAGGIVGTLNYGLVEECYNSGKLITDSSIGGIVGDIWHYGNNESVQIKQCYNLGEIVSVSESDKIDYIGGIVASMRVGTLTQCYNMGKITNTSSYKFGYVGGIVGDAFGSKAYDGEDADVAIVIEDCFNCGNIISSNDLIGGLIGYASSSEEDIPVVITHCYNVGKVELYNALPRARSAGIGTMWQSDVGIIQAEDNYYLEGEFHTPDSDAYASYVSIPATACSETQMTQTSTYKNWDFTNVWKSGSRKYAFPILRGVGESYLTYGYGGVGQDTVFGEYILQAVNKNNGYGVGMAVFSYQNQTVTADWDGIVRIIASDTDLGTVTVTNNHYEDWSGDVTLQYGKVNTIPMEPKKEINISKISANGNINLDTGKTTIENDTSNAVNANLPIKIDLKFKEFEDKEEGDNGAYVSDYIPIKITWEGKDKTKAKISIGSESKSQDEYKYAKNLLGKWGDLPSEDVLKEMGKSDIRKLNGKLGAKSVKVYILGYMTVDFSGGSPKVVESGAVAGIEGEGSITYRPIWAGTVAYGELKLNVGVEGKLKVSFDELLGYFDFSGELEPEIKLTVAVGIGYEFAKGEVGAEGSLSGKLNIKKNWNIQNDLEIKLAAVPHALLKIGFFNIKTDFDGWEWKWPETSSLSNDTGSTGIPIAAYSLMDRAYLASGAQNTMLFAAPSQSTIASITSLDIDGVYPEGEPQICSMSDGTQVAVWVADDGSKESADRTTIYYAVIKDDVITSYGPVYETGRGDYSPRLLAKGDSVYLAWMNADNTYGDSADFNEYYRHISLYLSVFDGTSFSSPVKVTADGNHLPMLTDLSSDGNGVVVTWVENSEDDAFFVKGSNTIYSRHYLAGALKETKVIAEGLPYIYSMDSGYVNGTYTVVWSQDTDGDLTSGADSELYMSHGGTITQLTDNTFEDINVRISADDLYWCSDGIIRRMPGLEKSLSESIGIACDDAFDVLQGEMGKAIIWLEKDGFITTPMISYEKGDAFTKPIPLGDSGSVNISGYNAVYEDDGNITLFYDVKEVYEEWTEAPYGQTNMRYTIGLSPSDILVDDYLYYDAAVTEPGQTLTFYTDVVNYTGSQINMLHLTLQADGEVLKEEDRTVELPVGGTETISVDYVLPQGFALGTYMLTVTASGVEENDLSNNQASAQVGYGNLALEDCDIEEKNDGSVIIFGNIVNRGYRSIGGKTMYIRVDGQDGEVIGQIGPVSLAVNESQPFTFTVEDSYIDFEYAYDTKYFHLSIEGDELETDFSDNSEYLVLQPILAESVDLENDFQMVVGESRELTVSITPQNAYADCLFTSSDLSVAAVDTKGTITAYGVGETVITAVTEDGKATDSCTVTVVAAGDEESLVAYSMSDTVVSLSVDEELTLQIYAQGEEGAEIEPVAVTWKSINEEIVTVADNHIEPGTNDDGDYVIAEGKIKALKEGSSVVIANVGESEVVFCVVTVTDDSVKVVTLEKTVYEMNKGETLQLVWESKPAGAQAFDFTFTSSENTVAEVDAEGKVYALAQGTARIEMSYTAGNGTGEIRAACIIEVTDPELTVYDLRFDTNGGSVLSDSIAYQSGKAGYTFVFPEAPTRPGYVFVGWNDMQDGSGITYSGNELLIAGENVLGDLTLYAVWLAASDGLWAAPVEDQVYTGSKLTPKAAVYDGTVLLTEGKDYTLSYKNNTKVANASDGKSAPGIVVKGKGNYTGSQTVNFNILPRNIGSSDGFAADDIWQKTNNKVQNPVPVIMYNGKKLTNKKDFKLEYPDTGDDPDAYKAAGVYSIKIIGIGNYTGERTLKFTITDGNLIGKASVSKIKNQPYTGEAIEPQLTVKYGKSVLAIGTDYTVRYENNIEIGKATAIITGQGAYAGEKKVTFTITGGNIKKAKVTGIPKSLVYTGEDLTIDSQSWGTVPVLTIVVNGETKVLTEGKDYNISYQKNNGVGTASIIFTGIKGYSGTLKKTFKITAYDISQDAEVKVSVVLNNNGEILYAKGGSRPKPIVTFGNVLLTEGKDYTLSYKNNNSVNDGTDPGKIPTITIKGKGNFKGNISRTYTIAQQELGVLSMNLPDKVYQAKKDAYKSTPKITDLDGKVLKAGKDYDKTFVYTYKNATELVDGTRRDAGEIVGIDDIIPAETVVEVEVTGEGNYKGSLKGEYRIVQKSISNAKVTVPAQEYTGKAIKPGKDVLKVKLGGTELGTDDYEIVSYSNNINKGNANITIKGVGNYGGSKTVKFTIKAKGFLWWWRS